MASNVEEGVGITARTKESPEATDQIKEATDNVQEKTAAVEGDKSTSNIVVAKGVVEGNATNLVADQSHKRDTDVLKRIRKDIADSHEDTEEFLRKPTEEEEKDKAEDRSDQSSEKSKSKPGGNIHEVDKTVYQVFFGAEYKGKPVHDYFHFRQKPALDEWHSNNQKLFKAVSEGDIEEVNDLIKVSDPNAFDTKLDNSTVLMAASALGYENIVSTLVSAGAELNSTNLHGRTALMEAAASGYLKVVQALVNCGADVKKLDKHGKSALSLANEKGRKEVVEFLESKISTKDDKDNVAVNPGVKRKDHSEASPRTSEETLSAETSPASDDQSDQTSLEKKVSSELLTRTILFPESYTSESGSNKQVEGKLSDIVSTKGATNLAADESHKPDVGGVVQRMQEVVADAHTAAVAVLQEPTEKESKVKAEDSSDQSSEKSKLKPGDGIHQVDKNLYQLFLGTEYRGKPVHDYFNFGQKSVLDEWNSNNQKLFKAVYEGDLQEVNDLIKVSDPNAFDPKLDNSTVLMVASACGYEDMVSKLVSAGAELNSTNLHGRTALMVAAERGYLKVVQALVNCGADVKKLDKLGKSALSLANEKEQKEVAKFLTSKISTKAENNVNSEGEQKDRSEASPGTSEETLIATAEPSPAASDGQSDETSMEKEISSELLAPAILSPESYSSASGSYEQVVPYTSSRGATEDESEPKG